MKKYIAPALEVIEIEEICTGSLRESIPVPTALETYDYEEGLEQQ